MGGVGEVCVMVKESCNTELWCLLQVCVGAGGAAAAAAADGAAHLGPTPQNVRACARACICCNTLPESKNVTICSQSQKL